MFLSEPALTLLAIRATIAHLLDHIKQISLHTYEWDLPAHDPVAGSEGSRELAH